jgi:hypothetical protein
VFYSVGVPLEIPPFYGEWTVTFERTGGGLPAHFSIGFSWADTGDTLRDAAQEFIDAWSAAGSLNEAQPTSVIATQLMTKINSGGTVAEIITPTPWAAGGGSPTLMSPAVSIVIKKSTFLAGQKFRGRFFLPWCAESDADGQGVLDSTVLGNYQDGATTLLQELVAGPAVTDVRLLHTDATTPTPILSFQVRNRVGTQRRRQFLP